jgi:hypothetical protein
VVVAPELRIAPGSRFASTASIHFALPEYSIPIAPVVLGLMADAAVADAPWVRWVVVAD